MLCQFPPSGLSSNLRPLNVAQQFYQATYRLQFMGYPQGMALATIQAHPPNTADHIYLEYMRKKIDEENTKAMSAAMDASK